MLLQSGDEMSHFTAAFADWNAYTLRFTEDFRLGPSVYDLLKALM